MSEKVTNKSFEPFPTRHQIVRPASQAKVTAETAAANQKSIDAHLQRLKEQYPSAAIGQQKVEAPDPKEAMRHRQAQYRQQQAPQSPVLPMDETEHQLRPDLSVVPHADSPTIAHNPSPRVAEAESISVGLPSKFAFYDFKDVFVHPLRGYHLSKMARAHAEKSLRIMVEAISSTLTTSHPEYAGQSIGHMLTVPDFYFIMFFQRQASYSKKTYTHRTMCTDPTHRQAVAEGKKSADSLQITEIVSKSMLKNTELETLPDPQLEQIVGLPLRPATMGDTIDWIEHPEFADPDVRWLGELATYIGTGEPFNQRVERANMLDPDQIQAIKDYEKQVSGYGIDEIITVRCKECGASKKTRVSLDAHSFLPN